MPAYLLLLVAVLSRLLPHAGWLNFTAVAALCFTLARAGRAGDAGAAVALMATDYLLTVYSYHYPFAWQLYAATWAGTGWRLALGQILLRSRTTFVRVAAARLLGPTSFFVVSNYVAWVSGFAYPYPHTLSGLLACYAAAVPSIRTTRLDGHCRGLAFGLPVLVAADERGAGTDGLAGK